MIDDVADSHDTDEGDAAGRWWVYRRDTRVRRTVQSLFGPASRHGCPVLAPEVQLLYKSAPPRARDEADFYAVRDALSPAQRQWLVNALELTAPTHPWHLHLNGS